LYISRKRLLEKNQLIGLTFPREKTAAAAADFVPAKILHFKCENFVDNVALCVGSFYFILRDRNQNDVQPF
jgi:hypothetical protein